MSEALTGIDRAVKSLNTLSRNIRSRVLGSQELDAKTASTASHLVEIIESIAVSLQRLENKLKTGEPGQGVVRLAPYTYVITGRGGVVLMRTRPEYIILSVDSEHGSVSVKARKTLLTAEPGRILMKTRGVGVEVNPLNIDDYKAKRNELKNALRSLEKVVNFKLASLLEH
ncbi:hypothetical protein [Desulfurococcus mucosus]|uniref:hypothetical protein n=1 Tax=Desulfurococcus mucosus TaxID=2275 RepID=UPI00064F5CA5|nr:hypothetical protein [Desulfurococcus mucosus]